ncbi:unnamed protein product [Adineta steineri]|uniref:C2H2-type domain-containing protein n=1 Tax=Adineta steineri TaxID=433720 RepID=A0A815FH96_9BILA|nr:unnamed protein product [Adineta steineri]CAF3809818.1 unnamed protein product [Adineta steineri]
MLHLPSMLTYGFLSFSMAFLNKALFEIAGFRNSLFVIFIQLLFVLLSFQILGYIRLMPIPLITRNDIYVFLVPSILYSLSTVLSLQALMKLNVAIYVVIKRCTPALTFILSALVLKKQKLSLKLGLCVFAITFGAVITSAGDLTFHGESYLIGGLSVIFQSLYLLTIQRCSEQKTSSDVLYINSLLSLPMVLVLMLVLTDEVSSVRSYNGYNTFSFWLYFMASTFGGGLLNGATFWCTMKNSALTTSVVGVLKSILQVFFGLFVFDRFSININTVVGIGLSLISGTIFSYLEYTSKQAKSATSMNSIDYDQQTHQLLNSSLDTQDITTNTEKIFGHATNEARFTSVYCVKPPCSREGSRVVRDYFTRALAPIYEKNQLAIPLECVFSPMRDIFYRHELHKHKISNDKWLCKYCNKTFLSEFYLDMHFVNRHNETLLINEQSTCLSDYCSIFRCEVLKRPKRSLRSLNPLRRTSGKTSRKPKRVINEQQLNVLRTHCSSLLNQCIPQSVNHDTRVKVQHQMYAEVCAYLTTNRYSELPTYRKPLVNFTTIFCLVIFIGMCLVGIGVVTHSDWKLDESDEYQAEKYLSPDTISTATALLSTTPANGMINSSKNTGASIRQRVRFKPPEGECQNLHTHSHSHHEHT